jgi:hypothetical protein
VRSLFVLGLAALAVGLCACGGDSGPSPEEEVRAAALRAIETEDPALFCRKLVTERFVDELFEGGLAACVKSDVVEEDPGEPKVGAVAIEGEDGARAEVAVSVAGGNLDGTSGRVEFVKQGERWKLDRYGDDYLRSSFLAAIENADDGVLAVESMKRCFSGQVEKMSAAEVREFVDDAAEGGDAYFGNLVSLSENCPEGMAEYGARELTDQLYETGKRKPVFIRCIRDELEAFLLLTDIAPDLLGEEPDEFAVATLEGIVTGAKKNCLEETGEKP